MPRRGYPNVCYRYKCEHCESIYMLVSGDKGRVLHVCHDDKDNWHGCAHCEKELLELIDIVQGRVEYFRVSGGWNEQSKTWKLHQKKWQPPKLEWKKYKWD